MKVIELLGLPRTGKTTLAKAIARSFVAPMHDDNTPSPRHPPVSITSDRALAKAVSEGHDGVPPVPYDSPLWEAELARRLACHVSAARRHGVELLVLDRGFCDMAVWSKTRRLNDGCETRDLYREEFELAAVAAWARVCDLDVQDPVRVQRYEDRKRGQWVDAPVQQTSAGDTFMPVIMTGLTVVDIIERHRATGVHEACDDVLFGDANTPAGRAGQAWLGRLQREYMRLHNDNAYCWAAGNADPETNAKKVLGVLAGG